MSQQTAAMDCVKVPKPGYRLIKKVYRSFQRFTFIVNINERNGLLPAGKMKVV